MHDINFIRNQPEVFDRLMKRLESGKNFYTDKIKTAGFFMNKILPEHYSLLAKIASGGKCL